MLFNSIEFGIFLPIVFLIHWFAFKSKESRNAFLLLSSYFFYGCWDWRFTFLLLFSTALDYFTGLKIHESNGFSRKVWLWTSIIINLGFLGVFKYYNFFLESLHDTGIIAQYNALKIILPVGISFYTFHGLSYVVDIYYCRAQPERNFVTYALFVSFFPLLVAGPIERATHLLPQLKSNRQFSYSNGVMGLRQILWGLFKKIVVADTCAIVVNDIFDHSDTYSGGTLAIGAVLFAFQIYGDFSGYSDIALGTARLLGIELLRNFAYPYFSRDIAEFWRRWHISLSSWFKDYVYIPLGGSRGTLWLTVFNTMVIFTLSGIWHGANWTFVVWGLLNALYILPSVILKRNRTHLSIVAQGRALPTFNEFISMVITFSLTVFAWIFFRAKDIDQALKYVGRVFSGSASSESTFPGSRILVIAAVLTTVMLVLEWRGREYSFALADGLFENPSLRYFFYCVISIAVLLFYGSNQEFIYFQF
jgi:alginate O-acetyltransferase complex protein AlgI